MAIIDVVEWNPSPNVYAWHHPNNQLNNKTQLIVREGQEAVLLNSGQAFGPFGPGQHTLNTSNYSFLSSLTKFGTGGDSPYTAEVWFISRAFKLDIKWGTTSAMQLEDPKYHIILPVRAFGSYGITVENSSKFLIKLAGMIPAFTASVLQEYFKGILLTRSKDVISEYIINKGISVLHLSAYLNEISAEIAQSAAEDLSDYGVKLTNFTVGSISTDENDPAVMRLRNALAERAEMDIIGYSYQQKRSFDTMETAAGNEGSGSLLNAGLGLGMGVNIGGSMGNVMGNMAGCIQPGTGRICPQCRHPLTGNAKYCSECGCKLNQHCPACGREVEPGGKFCPECGSSLN